MPLLGLGQNVCPKYRTCIHVVSAIKWPSGRAGRWVSHLMLPAAGMSARAFSLFQSVGWFGYAGYPNSARPWQNKQLWDWSHCCSADVQQNRFFGLIGALFGYTVCARKPCSACSHVHCLPLSKPDSQARYCIMEKCSRLQSAQYVVPRLEEGHF